MGGDEAVFDGPDGRDDPEVVALKNLQQPNAYILRFGAVSAVSKQQSDSLQGALNAKYGEALRRFEFSEGGDKIYLRFNKVVEADELSELVYEAWRLSAPDELVEANPLKRVSRGRR